MDQNSIVVILTIVSFFFKFLFDFKSMEQQQKLLIEQELKKLKKGNVFK